MMKKIFFKTLCLICCLSIPMTSCDFLEDIGIVSSDENQNGGFKDDINRGLVLHYTFDDENAVDATKKQCHGVLMNNPTFLDDTPNKRGKSLFVNGLKNQYVSIPYNPIADSTSFAMSFWLKDFTSGKIVSALDASANFDALTFSVLSDPRSFQFYPNGSKKVAFPNFNYTDIQTDSWHFITVVVSDAEKDVAKLFVDSKLIDVVSVSSPKSDAIKLQIGTSTNSMVSFKLDNFRIYNRSLSDKEVKQIYEKERFK